MQEANAQPVLEGNGFLNNLGQAHVDLPDLNLALGPMIVDKLNFPQPEPAMPVIAAPLEFYPILPDIEPPLNVQLDLNHELPPSPAIIESHVNAPLEISQLEDNLFSDEEDGSLFNLNLAEGEDPVIQLASPTEYLEALNRGGGPEYHCGLGN